MKKFPIIWNTMKNADYLTLYRTYLRNLSPVMKGIEADMRRHKKIRKYLAISLMVIGIAIMAFPKLYELYTDYKRNQLVSIWQEYIEEIETEPEEIDISSSESEQDVLFEEEVYKEWLAKKNDYATDMVKSSEPEVSPEESETLTKQQKEKEWRENYIKERMEALLKIDKIGFIQPVLEGATKTNLDYSVASINETGKPWLEGNYCIGGHRSHTYGRNFNRLEELNIGDEIEIVDLDNTSYHYQVTQKLIVDAKDVWVLNSNNDKKEITLITCHPMDVKDTPDRLIIKGELMNE